MNTILMWRHWDGGMAREVQRVASDLEKLVSPLFGTPPPARVLQNPAMSLIALHVPVRGWKPSFFQEDEQSWAFAVNYPINARTALAAAGTRFSDDNVLPTLCRKLEDDPTVFLREMAPPFALIWSSRQTDRTFVQTDGLAQAQLFEYQDDRLWALTNRMTALKALGVSLQPEAEEWGAQAALGWFPLNMTGYKRVRTLEPGTQIRLDANGIARKKYDVLSEWVHPESMSREDCLELGRSSLLGQIRAVVPQWDGPTVGLSGGRDSRAVLSCLRHLGVDFSARVKGLPGRPDVVIAVQVAAKGGFKLKVKHSAELPPDDADTCRSCISRALLWQAGHMVNHKHKTFLSGRPYLKGGDVNVMGQHGEIGRATWARRIGAAKLSEDRNEEALVGLFLRKAPPFMRKEQRNRVRQILQDAYRQADRYVLRGLARLDFFHVYERTRRWASATIASQEGLVFAPFLNPDYIRASFAYPGRDKETSPFHEYIIATNTPDWLSVPFTGPDATGAAGAPATAASDWRQPVGNENYSTSLYWQAVGQPIIREAFAQGGFWTEIYDPDLAKEHWHAAGDELAIAHLLPGVVETGAVRPLAEWANSTSTAT